KKDGAEKKWKAPAAAGDTTKRWRKDGAPDMSHRKNQAPAGDTTKRWKKEGADKRLKENKKKAA
ncbi:MAG TPA: hypothetical protein VIM79_02260, partial [Niastella sp.]